MFLADISFEQPPETLGDTMITMYTTIENRVHTEKLDTTSL